MKVAEAVNWQVGEAREVTSDDIDRLLQLIDSLRSMLFTREITLDQLIYQFSIPLVLTAQQSTRSPHAAELIRDFFLLSLRDFLCKHLSALANLSPEQKQTLFRVKSRLSCAVHFNYDMTEIALADERRHRDNETTFATLSGQAKRLCDAPPLDSVYTKRVSFMRHQTRDFSGRSSSTIDTTRVLTIESFRTTFSLYTVVNLHPRSIVAVNAERFTSDAERAEAGSNAYRPTDDGNERAKRYGRKRRAADTPPLAQAAMRLTMSFVIRAFVNPLMHNPGTHSARKATRVMPLSATARHRLSGQNKWYCNILTTS